MIAYFSMEIAVDPQMPTYSGGLGVLAADTIFAAADMKLPMVAVTLLSRKGYCRQKLDRAGWQTESPVEWQPEKFLQELPQRASVLIEGRQVALRAWKYECVGNSGGTVPIIFLDTDLPENSDWDRTLTNVLYGGDSHYRLCQEVVLGIGGVRMLRALGYRRIDRYHMNEGHASLLVLELLDESAQGAGRDLFTHDDVEIVRRQCIFTTHTPVPAGHDQFALETVARVLGRSEMFSMKEVFCCEGRVNLTLLGFNVSHYINGVAKRHGELSQRLFGKYTIDAITNGVHAPRWASPPFQILFDRYVPGWREDNASLRTVLSVSRHEIWNAHQQAKQILIDRVNGETNSEMRPGALTLGFARRAAAYKRPDLLFRDTARLKQIAAKAGLLQLVFAGKAHPQDQPAKELIQRISEIGRGLGPKIKFAYLPDYDLESALTIIAGVDVWLNTPQPPLEASGTSGMKAALNGVPSLSVLDGWWAEGHIEGITGWSIGERTNGHGEPSPVDDDARSLYDKLEHIVVPMFADERDRFVDVMRHCIALNGSYFNAQRMLQQYVVKAYFQ